MLRQDCCDGSLKWPTILSGDFDSISMETKELFTSHSAVIETPDQDKTDLTKCLEIVAQREEVLKKEVETILVLGGFSGRFDHTLASLNTFLLSHELTPIPVLALDGENLITVLSKGKHEILIDNSKTTGICGLVPFCQQVTIVTIDGFQWNLENFELKYGGLISTSNRIVSNKLKIETSSPLIFTMELLENEIL
uniref:Thiamine diphosphokinase n=1 Tax=Acrobeloides nanus TaxID=290746 RepID=A0A914BX22_9BILA